MNRSFISWQNLHFVYICWVKIRRYFCILWIIYIFFIRLACSFA